MPRNTTLNLPEALIERARGYAAAEGTSLTAIVRGHLEAITEGALGPAPTDVLAEYVEGRMTKEDAVRALGLRDYSELLLALGKAGIPLPTLPAHVLRDQAMLFAEIWKRS